MKGSGETPPSARLPHAEASTDGSLGPAARLLHAVGVTGAGTAAGILVGVVTNKALALLIGPSGLGVVSQLTVFRALVMTVVAAGLQPSMTRFVAAAAARSPEAALPLQRSGVSFSIGLGLLVSGAAWTLHSEIGRWLFAAPGFNALTVVCAVGGAIGGVALVFQGILNGYREIGALAVSAAGVSVANLALMVTLASLFGATGAGAAVALLPLCNLAIYAGAVRARGHRLWGRGKPSLGALAAPLRLGVAALSATFTYTAALLGSRRLVIGMFGLQGVGWYQSVLTISDQYFNLLTTSVTTYVLPTLAAYQHDKERADEVNRVARVMFVMLTPFVSGALVFKELLVRVLYSGAFLPAVSILQWQLLGGYFRLAGWTLGSPLLVVASPGVIIVQELIWDAAYLSGVYVLGRWLGLPGIGVAFVGASLLHASVLWAYMRWRIGFRWSARNRALLLTSLGTIVAVLLMAPLGLVGRAAGAAVVLLLWGWVNVRRTEVTHVRAVIHHVLGGGGRQ